MESKFTLIELLVVVAIIGILTSLLLPSLSNARATSRAVVCKSNQKNMYLGYYMHSEDGFSASAAGYPRGITENSSHSPGQFIGIHSINMRIKIDILGLANIREINCSEYDGNLSSYGFNTEQTHCHTGTYNQRIYFHNVLSTSDLS